VLFEIYINFNWFKRIWHDYQLTPITFGKSYLVLVLVLVLADINHLYSFHTTQKLAHMLLKWGGDILMKLKFFKQQNPNIYFFFNKFPAPKVIIFETCQILNMNIFLCRNSSLIFHVKILLIPLDSNPICLNHS
jgi:hypothetical protein